MICTQCERLFVGKIAWPGIRTWSVALRMPHICASCRVQDANGKRSTLYLPIPVTSPELADYKTRRGQFFAAQDALRELATRDRIREATRKRSEWHEEEEDDYDMQQL